ncbi:MAG TPA: hypothetical protein VFT74_01440 [Isosphaeraceae bacterium]|nr:hypothetical protein [Isosphaeraceae bacterium]
MTTVTTATTIAIGSTPGSTDALALIAIVTLLLLLLYREVVTANDGPSAAATNRTLRVAVVPLLLAFLLIAGVRLAGVLH